MRLEKSPCFKMLLEKNLIRCANKKVPEWSSLIKGYSFAFFRSGDYNVGPDLNLSCLFDLI